MSNTPENYVSTMYCLRTIWDSLTPSCCPMAGGGTQLCSDRDFEFIGIGEAPILDPFDLACCGLLVVRAELPRGTVRTTVSRLPICRFLPTSSRVRHPLRRRDQRGGPTAFIVHCALATIFSCRPAGTIVSG